MVRYAITIFLSAFLLFQVQPMIGKYILPWFGGGPAVWTTCMLFFQMLLLAGYSYAHLIATKLSQHRQVVVHGVVLVAAMVLLPIAPSEGWKPTGAGDPTWRILALLAASVGLPYFLLSTTGPLLQAWFSRTEPGRSPYRLYALSNAGSLLALLSYPFVFEPAFALRHQALGWSAAFVVFALLCGWCGIRTWHVRARGLATTSQESSTAGDTARRPTAGAVALWLGLSACGSVLLLSVTNHICYDVAVVPFLWVLPLSLYLLTFILCFDSDRWYVRPVFWGLLALSLPALVWLMYQGVEAPMRWQVLGFAGGLFVCCMVCHGELVRLRPSPRHLTAFYLTISAGGALGGLLVTLVAPRVFAMYLELHLGLWLCLALAVVAFWYTERPFRRWRRKWVAWACLQLCLFGLVGLGEALRRHAAEEGDGWLARSRNFYGVLSVGEFYDEDEDPRRTMRTLVCGRIDHGSQFTHAERLREPITYYGAQSGIGLALSHYPRHSPLHVGVLGLGIGTMAAYGQDGDQFRFYEINPEVERLARKHFTYLADSEADCRVVLGDGRLSLEREPPERFDILALDAFTSDAVPVHLLTREAFAIYLRHMKPGGLIVANISNRYLDLRPVLLAVASHYDLGAVVIDYEPETDEPEDGTCPSSFVLLTRNRRLRHRQPLHPAIRAAVDASDVPPERRLLWTDDYSNLFQTLW
ncbi:spermidine synthase [Planctomycetota bacterium]